MQRSSPHERCVTTLLMAAKETSKQHPQRAITLKQVRKIDNHRPMGTFGLGSGRDLLAEKLHYAWMREC